MDDGGGKSRRQRRWTEERRDDGRSSGMREPMGCAAKEARERRKVLYVRRADVATDTKNTTQLHGRK